MNQSGYQHKFWKAHLCSPLLLLAAHRCGALAGGSPPFSQMLNVGASNCSGVQAVFQRIHIFIYLCAVVTKVTRGFSVVKIQLFSVQDTFSTLFKKSNISKTERVRGAFSFSLTIITVSKTGFFFNIEREHFLWVNLIKGLVNFLKHTWNKRKGKFSFWNIVVFIFPVNNLVLLLPMKIFSSFPKSPPRFLPAHHNFDSHNVHKNTIHILLLFIFFQTQMKRKKNWTRTYNNDWQWKNLFSFQL